MEVDLKNEPYLYEENYHDQLYYALDYVKECLAVYQEDTDAAIEKLHRMNPRHFRLNTALRINIKEQVDLLKLVVALGRGLKFLTEAENNIKKRIRKEESH